MAGMKWYKVWLVGSTTLFEIDYTPKGTKTMKTVKVWARNRLDASNYMIMNHIWGKQHEIRAATANFLK